MYAPQLEAYRTIQNSNAQGKGIEAAVLTQSALLPSDYRKNWDTPGRAIYVQQLETYRTAQNSNASGREIEAGALTRCALLLSDCQKNWDAPGREEMLADALRTNQKVWSIFQSELARKDNPLPKKLKEDILSLSLFIDKRILEVMAYPAPEKTQDSDRHQSEPGRRASRQRSQVISCLCRKLPTKQRHRQKEFIGLESRISEERQKDQSKPVVSLLIPGGYKGRFRGILRNTVTPA